MEAVAEAPAATACLIEFPTAATGRPAAVTVLRVAMVPLAGATARMVPAVADTVIQSWVASPEACTTCSIITIEHLMVATEAVADHRATLTLAIPTVAPVVARAAVRDRTLPVTVARVEAPAVALGAAQVVITLLAPLQPVAITLTRPSRLPAVPSVMRLT